MIGVSLRTKWFYEPGSAPVPLDTLFGYLKNKNVQSVELRSVRPSHESEQVKNACDLLWANGFNVTVHSRVNSLESCISDIFDNLESTLLNLKQEFLIITIHPIDDDNALMLTMLSEHITNNGYKAKIALENNRLLPNGDEGDSTALVADAVMRAGKENVGICFDMGHLAYFVKKNCDDDSDYKINPEFLKRVIHTHIHGTSGLTTHYPMSDEDVRTSSFMNALSHGYLGVYNIELDFPRIQKLWEPLPALECAINYLTKNLSHCARLYDDIRENFDSRLLECLDKIKESSDGTKVGVLNASTYLFNTNNFLWCIDPAFRNAYTLAKTPNDIAKILGDFKLFIISHAHSDHFEKQTIKRLCQTDATWLTPDFILDDAISLGIKKENIVSISAGQSVRIGNIEITAFDGAHFRPITGKGLKEYGYSIKTCDDLTLNFPVDVRDYQKERPEFVPKANYCFAHLWLNDNSADPVKFTPYLEPFARYSLKFSDENIFIAHLYENGRDDSHMWRIEHAKLASDTVQKLSPQTSVQILTHGKVVKLV